MQVGFCFFSSFITFYRENYCFSKEDVDIYCISERGEQAPPQPEVPRAISLSDNVDFLSTELYKVNRVLIYFNKRLEELEKLNGVQWEEGNQ